MRSRRAVVSLALALVCAAVVRAPAMAQAVERPLAQPTDADISKLSRAGEGRTIGPDTARVVILEFFDYSCPHCQAFHKEHADSLKKAIGPNVRIAYVTFLLTSHMRSYHGAEAGLCAGFVGGSAAYTAMSDRLFRRADEWQNALDPGPVFTKFAKEAGIDSAAYAECRGRDAVAPLIASDMETAGKFDIKGTPTFVVLPRGATSPSDAFSISGNASIAELMSLVSQARAKAK